MQENHSVVPAQSGNWQQQLEAKEPFQRLVQAQDMQPLVADDEDEGDES